MLYVCSTTCLIKLKRFLIILYVFGSDFCHPLCSCLVLIFFFIVLNMFCVEKKKGVRVFHDSLASHETGKMHFLHIFWFFGREVRDSLMSEHSSRQKDFKNFMKIVFVTHLTTRLVMKRLETAF